MDITKQQPEFDEEQTGGQRDKAIHDFVKDIKRFAANLEMLVANDIEEAKNMHKQRAIENTTAQIVRLNGMSLDWADREMNQLMEKNNKLRANLRWWADQLAKFDRQARVAKFNKEPTPKVIRLMTDDSEEKY